MSIIIKNLTVAILTYRRPFQLKKCLKALKSQPYQPAKYMVINSYTLHQNIPQCRNLAIRRCRTQFLAFIDDDCVANNDWLKVARDSIQKHKKYSFIVGRTLLLNSHNYLATVLFNHYQQYFYPSHPLDTKNCILNLKILKGKKFDQKFDIFEDVDFNLQIFSSKLSGVYCHKLLVNHPETTNILVAILKKYRQGMFKARLNTKWGNFDSFTPSIPQTKNVFDFLLKSAFNLGYHHHPPNLITIINHLDRGANEQRLKQFQNYFLSKHYHPTIIDSHLEFNKVIASRRYLIIYGWSLLKYRFLKSYYESINQNNYYPLLPLTQKLKQQILTRILHNNYTSLAIIQYPEDMQVCLTKNRRFMTLYDSPTILSEELKSSDSIDRNTINKIIKIEKKVFAQTDITSFHWYTYFKIAKDLGIEINNPIKLNWPSRPSPSIARFSTSPRIVYLGILNSYWVNPQLLINLSKLYPIDVFSYQKPDPKIYPQGSINYKGYLNNLDELSNYQLGLVTLSTDTFRSSGFSAKHIDYLNHGLPVLSPKWRQDKLLSTTVIQYDLNNFLSQIKKNSVKSKWDEKHINSLSISQSLKPKTSLKNIDALISMFKP